MSHDAKQQTLNRTHATSLERVTTGQIGGQTVETSAGWVQLPKQFPGIVQDYVQVFRLILFVNKERHVGHRL